MSLGIAFLWGGAAILAFVTLIWILSLIVKNSAIMDIFWGMGLLMSALVYGWLLGVNHLSAFVLQLLVAVWALRLSVYIFFRNLGKPEDVRYANWRRENGNRWWWYSFLKVFLLQGVIMWIVSVALLTGQGADSVSELTWLSYAGIALFIIGFIFEAGGDWQLSRFKKNPANKGKVMDSGLWAFTRHPNYFGESVIWWGFFLIAMESGNWLSLISPILMTFLLTKVSGVAMLDKVMSEAKPQYRDYIASTSAFFPMPKRRRAK
jgi:steroid 5-alpha reductase family enzyme